MPNEMLNNMEFENRLADMGDNQLELIKFIARQQFASSRIVATHGKDIASLKEGDRKASSIAGSISGTITSVIIGVINYFLTRRS